MLLHPGYAFYDPAIAPRSKILTWFILFSRLSPCFSGWGSRSPLRARHQANRAGWNKDAWGRWNCSFQDVRGLPSILICNQPWLTQLLGVQSSSDSMVGPPSGKNVELAMFDCCPIRNPRKCDSLCDATRLWKSALITSVRGVSRFIDTVVLIISLSLRWYEIAG